MAIIMTTDVTIEVTLTFRFPLGCPFGLLLVFLTRPEFDFSIQTVRFVNINDLSRSFPDFNTFRYLHTFEQINKTVDDTVF